MSQTFGDLELAAKTKEVISTLVRKEVEKIRPAPRYAVVTTLDPLTVTYSGDPTPMPVRTGSVVPSAVGQIVRIEGPPQDRYVADVVGGVDETVPPYEPGGSNEFPDGIIIGDEDDPLNPPISVLPTPPGDVTGVEVLQGLEFENIYFIIEWDLIPEAAAYEVEVAEKLGANVYDLARVVRTSAQVARVDQLQPYTEYGVRVAAISNIGLRGTVTPWLDVLTAGDNTIPPQVTVPTLSRGATSLIVSYPPLNALDAPDVANGNGLYEVQIDTVNTFNSADLRSNLTTASIVAFSDLTFTATWYARVRAIDTSGNLGAWSNIASLEAGQITTSHIGDGQITSDKIVTAGLDAAVIKFGTMSGDRITANTLSVNRLMTSTLTATTITLGSGGQIKIGNPTTNGIYINDQGIRAYNGGATTFQIDSSGNATFGGTLSAGISITSPTITGGTLNGSLIKTFSGSVGPGVELGHNVFGSFSYMRFRFNNSNVLNDGYVSLSGAGTSATQAAVIIYGPRLNSSSAAYQPSIELRGNTGSRHSQLYFFANEYYFANGGGGTTPRAYFSNNVDINGAANIGGGLTASGQITAAAVDTNELRGSITFQPGSYSRIIADPNNRNGAFYVYCPSYIYATSATGSTLTYNTSTGQISYTSSTIKIKRDVSDLKRHTSRKVLDLQPRQWYPRTDLEGELGDNDKLHIKHRYKLTGLVAEEVYAIDPTFAIVNGRNEPIGIDWQAVTGMLIEEVKKLREEMDALAKSGV